MVARSDREVVGFKITGGQVHDSTQAIELLEEIRIKPEFKYVIMDRAYEAKSIRDKITEMGYIPVVPPKINRKEKWEYDKEVYKRRNERSSR